MNRSRALRWGLVLGLTLFFLALVTPHWLAYWHAPLKENVRWDQSTHWLDGILLYLSLAHLDFASFLHRLITFGFWLPVHPLLVCITQIFFPFRIEPVVFINYLFFACSLSAGILILSDHLRNAVLILIFLLPVLYGLLQSVTFVSVLNDPMLELIDFGLQILVGICVWSYFVQKRTDHFRLGCIFLFGLFMTKIHYGLFAFFPLFICLTLDAIRQRRLGLAVHAFGRFTRRLGHSRLNFFLAGLEIAALGLIVFKKLTHLEGFTWVGIKISMHGITNLVWFILFIPLLAWTRAWWKKDPFFEIFSEPLRNLHTLCLLPFTWYYLFPLKHKLGAFFHNMDFPDTRVDQSFNGKARFYLDVLRDDFFSGDTQGNLPKIILFGIALSFFTVMARRKNWLGSAYIVFGILITYLLLSFCNPISEYRVAVPLCAFLTTLVILAGHCFYRATENFSIFNPKVAQFLFAGSLLASSYFFIEHLDQKKIERITQSNFLLEGRSMHEYVIEHFSPNQSGLIYGLGLNASSPGLGIQLLKKTHYRYLRAFRRPLADIFDLGREGNQAPVKFIEENLNIRNYRQIVLYKMTFSPIEIKTLVDYCVKYSTYHLQPVRETPYFVFLDSAPD